MFTDAQIRSKLKEFAQYLKKGENTGWWKLKNNLILPDEDGIRKLVTPESICLQESTLVAQQRLKDTGYGAEDLKQADDEENESQLDIEVQLAPWTTTKNFLAAASGKGMVQLFGPGDPTGCGEGFSYIRASMKEMFFHHAETEAGRNAYTDYKAKSTYHKYSIVEQQKVYKQEIERIWTNQYKTLSARLSQAENSGKALKSSSDRSDSRVTNAVNGNQQSNNVSYSDDEDGQSLHGSILGGKDKMLVINRLVRGENGEVSWKSEVVTDRRVINAYIRHRTMIEAPQKYKAINIRIVEGVTPETDIKARIKRRTNAHIVKLQVKQGKRQPLPEVEDISESELPNEVQKPLPVVLKIPSIATELEKSSSAKRKKLSTDSLPQIQLKLTTKRRTSPECDLSEIFEMVVSELISIPEAGSFCNPVSQFNVPDYYDIVKKPICLEQIRDKVRNFKYLSCNTFTDDIKLISENCNLYNGPGHPLTKISEDLYEKATALLDKEKEKLSKLESEIKSKAKPEEIQVIATREEKEGASDIDIL